MKSIIKVFAPSDAKLNIQFTKANEPLLVQQPTDWKEAMKTLEEKFREVVNAYGESRIDYAYQQKIYGTFALEMDILYELEIKNGENAVRKSINANFTLEEAYLERSFRNDFIKSCKSFPQIFESYEQQRAKTESLYKDSLNQSHFKQYTAFLSKNADKIKRFKFCLKAIKMLETYIYPKSENYAATPVTSATANSQGKVKK